jgi:hypothetical protein
MDPKELTGEAVLDYLAVNSGAPWGNLCKFHFMELFYCLESLIEVEIVSVDGVQASHIDGFYKSVLLESDTPRVRTVSKSRKTRYALRTIFDVTGGENPSPSHSPLE